MTAVSERPVLAVEPEDPTGPIPVVADRAAPIPERRRSLSRFRRTDAFALAGAALGSGAMSALLFGQLAALSGSVGFAVCWYVAFLGLYALLVSFDEDGPAVRDRLAATVVHSLAALMFTALLVVVGFTLWKGISVIGRINFWLQDMTLAGPLEPLSVGGIRHAVIGTLWMIGIALVITVPLGLGCAIFLNEFPGRFARFVRTIAEAMTALPSIVAGLFIYAVFILILGFEKSGLAAALALAVMMLPIIIRSADVVLRLVPASLKEASYALGSSRWRTVRDVILPTSRSGLATAVILGTARGIGETSPVLLTAGFTAQTNTNPFAGPMVSLPLATFQFVKSPEPNIIARGFGAAAVLLMLVLVLFVIARIIGGRGPGHLSPRQQRRLAKRSQEDVRRFESRATSTASSVSADRKASDPSDPGVPS
jgi:phosphate transport system permease protein